MSAISAASFPPVGVVYFDAGHAFSGTLLPLRGVRFHLAALAIRVVDNADWPHVNLAVDQFVSNNPEARLAFRISGRVCRSGGWWYGVDVIPWKVSGREFDRDPSQRQTDLS